MADVNSRSKLPLKRALILLGLALLTGVFAWLTFLEVQLFLETWRVRPNVIILVKAGFRILIMLMLTAGSSLGPAVFLIKWLRGNDRNVSKRDSDRRGD